MGRGPSKGQEIKTQGGKKSKRKGKPTYMSTALQREKVDKTRRG